MHSARNGNFGDFDLEKEVEEDGDADMDSCESNRKYLEPRGSWYSRR